MACSPAARRRCARLAPTRRQRRALRRPAPRRVEAGASSSAPENGRAREPEPEGAPGPGARAAGASDGEALAAAAVDALDALCELEVRSLDGESLGRLASTLGLWRNRLGAESSRRASERAEHERLMRRQAEAARSARPPTAVARLAEVLTRAFLRARIDGLGAERDAVQSLVRASLQAYEQQLTLAELQLELASIEEAMASRATLPKEVATKRDAELQLLFKWIETVYITQRLAEAMEEAKAKAKGASGKQEQREAADDTDAGAGGVIGEQSTAEGAGEGGGGAEAGHGDDDEEASNDPVAEALSLGSPEMARFVHGVVTMSREQAYDARRQMLEAQFQGQVPPGSAIGTMRASMRLVLLTLDAWDKAKAAGSASEADSSTDAEDGANAGSEA